MNLYDNLERWRLEELQKSCKDEKERALLLESKVLEKDTLASKQEKTIQSLQLQIQVTEHITVAATRYH